MTNLPFTLTGTGALGLIIASAALYALYNLVYNIWFHPLRRFPGPFWWRASRAPFCRELIKGTMSFRILDLHRKYGSVVRIAPNELSFSDTEAWKDIHGHKAHLDKWTTFYRPVESMPTDVASCQREEHTVLRRQLSHGFSDRSLREQEPLISKYVDMFMNGVRGVSNKGTTPVDLAAWFNYLTFDVIGDLSFGEPFGCLKESNYHPWVKAIFQMGHVGVYMQTASHYPWVKNLLLSLVPEKAKRERESHLEFTKAKLKRRMALGQNRPDLIEGLLKKDLDMEHLEANASILIMGGSETTATLLAGATYFLTSYPETLKKLTDEVRSSFKSEEEINFQSVNSLEYLSACLNEALRLYPPVPNGLPRVVPQGGTTIAGHHVPENSIVAIHQWAMYHTEQHFKRPLDFCPERWLGGKEFEDDHLDAVQPFHIGPRNCLGRNLAYVEMRVVMSRLLWNFDLKISEESRDWLDQKIFLFWAKGPLHVYLVPVSR
ncbi:hypothetical protein FDECE_17731 [Fusarium decemcellulare]|nr:hypothetical protein FDECE_17731 [Fusarium decemcellulare]